MTWSNANGSLPQGHFLAGATRFSLGISHLAGQRHRCSTPASTTSTRRAPTTRARCGASDSDGARLEALTAPAVRRPTRTASSTTAPRSASTTTCVAPDPINPNIVYVEGSYGYDQSPQSGGIYRSTDGGAHWKSLGYDLHPDFHALAFEPDNTKHVVIGNDGGVWQSQQPGRPAGRRVAAVHRRLGEPQRHGEPGDGRPGAQRPACGSPSSSASRPCPRWPAATGAGPRTTGRIRKSTANDRWFDQPSGDGGQVLVDPTDEGYVVRHLLRASRRTASPLTTSSRSSATSSIDGGIDTKERAEFYVPWVMNKGNTEPAVPRHLPALPDRQRRGGQVGGDVALGRRSAVT